MSSAILLSGGMDSVALAAWKRPKHAITIDYGQLAAKGEIRASAQVCIEFGIEHHIIAIDCRELGSGDLAGTAASSIAPVPEWWPYRNQMLLTFGAMKAVTLGVCELLCGSVKTDAAHADGSEEFYQQMDKVVSLQEGSLRVVAPAIRLTTSELIRTAGVDISVLRWCHSCHVNQFACGRCRGCCKYRGVLFELGHYDTIIKDA